MNIYLIGYRGSGKSTIARLAAVRLWRHWVDADVQLELQAGTTIKQIFASEGEPGFRDRESAVLAQLARQTMLIAALGGGAVLREANREILADSGKTVWLQASPELLWSRITGDATTAERRPDLTAGGGLDEVRRLLIERTPLYQQCADFTLPTDNRSPEEIADAVADWATQNHW